MTHDDIRDAWLAHELRGIMNEDNISQRQEYHVERMRLRAQRERAERFDRLLCAALAGVGGDMEANVGWLAMRAWHAAKEAYDMDLPDIVVEEA